MTVPSQGLPMPLIIHVVDASGNDVPVENIPAVGVGGAKGKNNITFLRFELWSKWGGQDDQYWQGELHLFLRLN